MNQPTSVNYRSLAAQMGILGRMRGRELTASCPLHSERNPSFSLNTETGLWKCFSRCGAGNFTQLVERKMNFSYQEAVRWINTNGAGNSLEQLLKTFSDLEASSVPGTEVNDPQHWKTNYLALNRNFMPQWLLDRGFTWETINHWQMVYDLGMQALVIPVFWEGAWVGTVTRNTYEDLPKYQNSWLMPVENIFFGEISASRRDIIICEGVLDVVWLWQLGYHAVSVLGANLTEQQVGILRRYQFGEITLAFDNDDAGRRAKENAVNALIRGGWLRYQIKAIEFPGKNKADPAYRKDPNDCSELEFGQLYSDRKVVFL